MGLDRFLRGKFESRESYDARMDSTRLELISDQDAKSFRRFCQAYGHIPIDPFEEELSQRGELDLRNSTKDSSYAY